MTASSAHELLIVVLALAYVLTSAVATADVLLRNRSVRAAIGWISLVWLSPIIGAALYSVLGVNRVRRRALNLRRPGAGHDPARVRPSSATLPENLAVLARVVRSLTGQELASGNRIDILRSGDEAYPAMLAAIRQASTSVALASYIFRADDAGLAFAKALEEAVARGVEVRVLVDGFGAGYPSSPIARALRRRDITVARFLHSWSPWRMPYLNLRLHKKILVVDGVVGFTGGINISGDNVLAKSPAHPVDDIHFCLQGPAVRHLMLAFAEDWSFTTGEMLSEARWWPEPADAGPVLARGFSSGPDHTVGRLPAVIAEAIGSARRHLKIVTPYFLPDEDLLFTLELAALRGATVDIVLPERSNHIVIDWASRAHLGFLAAAVRIHLSPPPFSHAKLMTVDGEWCLLGTPNWDVRSARLNFEFSLECYDRALTGEIDRIIDERMSSARLVTPAQLAARALPLKLRDGAARLLLPYL